MNKEISLRELIEIILKGWKLIVLVTFVCIIVVLLANEYLLEPVYEAKTVLMASYATEKLSDNNSDDDVENILDSISMYPSMTIETYKEQLNSPEVLKETIDELGLEEENIDVSNLTDMISLSTISDTNLISVNVTYNNPEMAAEIANTLAHKFTEFITEMSKDRALKSSEFLETQLETEKIKLDDALLELKEFLSQPRGVDELEREVKSVLTMLNEYKTQVVKNEVELSKVISGLSAAELELEKIPAKIIVTKTLDNDALINQVVSESTGMTIADASQLTMGSEEINENYLAMEILVAEYKIQKAELEKEIEVLNNKILDYQNELEEIQQDLAGKSYEKTLIDNKIIIAQDTYDAFLKKYEDSLIAESAKVGESYIDIVSSAISPKYPIAPRKVFNLAIGAVLGFLFGIFAVLFRAYWIFSGQIKTQ